MASEHDERQTVCPACVLSNDGPVKVRLCAAHEGSAVNHVEFITAADTAVDHPAHYGGANNPYEAIKVIDAWALGFALGNAVKYIARAGKKDGVSDVEDLKKARWYLDHEITQRSKEQA